MIERLFCNLRVIFWDIYKRVNPHFVTLMWQNEQSLPHNSRSLVNSLVKPQKITIFAFGNEIAYCAHV